MRWSVRLELEPSDCWLGVFWRRGYGRLDIWICLLPCLPLHIRRDASLRW